MALNLPQTILRRGFLRTPTLASAAILAALALAACPGGASPLQPTAQELGAFAMARALTLCYSTRLGMGLNRSRSLAREILNKTGFDPDGAWVAVAASTESLADDLYKGLSPSCEISEAYVQGASKRAAETFKP
ncbi:hypothetical protein [Cyanobium sp. Morenito 9A2]|uniref:hypothetical protein n=1 Tax=Cyanobium sp. Morenito 9A2 TaxID=2823718 RepID=UPI0020CD8F5B|nr:hypothetical protein [Cyanobium sp. Morenito 9A2]MCP9849360.1 hypothetical protein [Cyanobium sp. Morenito 9A2]